VQGAILSGGLALRWLRDLLGLAERVDAYAALSDLAAGAPAGAEGLIFLPYLAGERTPHMDAQAAGVFLGLRLHHEAGHLARAVREGVGFALKECLDLVVDDPAQVILSGGITRSTIWPQIAADIWGVPVEVVGASMLEANIPEGDVPRACLGAAVLAGVGTGVYGNAREALGRRAEPTLVIDPQNQTVYAERYEQYRRLYPLLRDEMHALGNP
jgi:xylulokinase